MNERFITVYKNKFAFKKEVNNKIKSAEDTSFSFNC